MPCMGRREEPAFSLPDRRESSFPGSSQAPCGGDWKTPGCNRETAHTQILDREERLLFVTQIKSSVTFVAMNSCCIADSHAVTGLGKSWK